MSDNGEGTANGAAQTLANPRQVYLYLKDRYQVGEKTIYRHVEEGKLKPKRGGGFTFRAVESYAKSHFTPVVDDSQDYDPDQDVAGTGERRQLADALLKEEQARRAKLKRLQDEAELIKTALVEEELVARARIFSIGMENFFQERIPEVVEMVGGCESRAKEIIKLVSGDPEKSEALVQWMQSRVPDLIAFFLEQKEDWLHSYATGSWYTEEMAQAMERWEHCQYAEE
jgi:hypothetical protein